MKKQITIFLASALLLIGACKKEDCPELESYVPYTSTMKGEMSSGLTFTVTNVSAGCNGWFIKEIFNAGVYVYKNDFNIQVVEGFPDSLKEWNKYNGKEFIIDFEFIGTGYECKYIDGLTEVSPPLRPVEQVKITKIEEAP